MNDDLSNRVIVVLVILTVLFSLVNAFLLVSFNKHSSSVAMVSDSAKNSGQVSFKIHRPTISNSNAQIKFKIINKQNNG